MSKWNTDYAVEDSPKAFSFWNTCNTDGTCGILKAASSDYGCNVTNSSIMGVSRVEKDPQNCAFFTLPPSQSPYRGLILL